MQRTFKILTSFAVLSLVVAAATAQSDSRKRLQEARGLVSAQQFSEARPMVDRILKDEPDNLGAWYLLGRIHVGLAEYDAAIPALARAKDFPPARAAVIRETFLALAGKGDFEAALALKADVLDKAAVDLSSLHLRPEFHRLSTDPRFADLFPTSFGDPFVEGEAVIHDWHGEGQAHEFGWDAGRRRWRRTPRCGHLGSRQPAWR